MFPEFIILLTWYENARTWQLLSRLQLLSRPHPAPIPSAITHRGSTPSHTFPHSTTMSQGAGFDNRRPYITLKIRSLLASLPKGSPEYDKAAPDIEFWIEYVLRERFMTVDELVEGVSWAAWHQSNYASVARFLKEFRDAPHRSEQARSFVDKLCEHVLRWFSIASVEDPMAYRKYYEEKVTTRGGEGFVCAASFVGHLIESGVLGHELVRRHLVKPLTAHHHGGQDDANVFRASAICQLFAAAGNTLLRGLLEPEDVEGCFETLNAQMNPIGKQLGLSITGELQVRRVTHSSAALQHLTCLIRNSVGSILHG